MNTVHSGGQPYATLHIGCDSVPMKFKVDTGAEIKVLPITAFDKFAEICMNRLKPTQVRLTGYSRNVVPTTGKCQIECKLREKPHTLEFFIADTNAMPILGFDSCRAMELLKIENRVLKMTQTEVAALNTDPRHRHYVTDARHRRYVTDARHRRRVVTDPRQNFSNAETRVLLKEVGLEKTTLSSCFSNEVSNSKKNMGRN